MAGINFEILAPGYTNLTTRDIPYTPGGGEAATLNPFDPNSARPLIEGEWLEYASTGAGDLLTRGGDDTVTAPGTPDGQATNMSFPYFLEGGRYDAQALAKAHIIMGPTGCLIRTRVCDSDGLAAGSPVGVFDIDTLGAIVRRGLALAGSGTLAVGTVTRVHGTNDISVWFHPHTVA